MEKWISWADIKGPIVGTVIGGIILYAWHSFTRSTVRRRG